MKKAVRTVAYIDSSNLLMGIGKVDYKSLLAYLNGRYVTSAGSHLQAKVFVPVLSPGAKTEFLAHLTRLGYELIVTDCFKRAWNKDNSDLKIAVEMSRDLWGGAVDNFVLVSGDKDFLFVIQDIVHAGRNIDVIGPREETCWEYKSMQTFVPLESIYGIHYYGGRQAAFQGREI